MAKILYISSANPLKGPGTIAMDHIKALNQAGHEVEFLTKNPVEGFPEIKYVEKHSSNRIISFLKFRLERFRKRKFFELQKNAKPLNDEGPFCYFYRKENEPPIPIKNVLRKTDRNYDMIIIYFWQGLLSYKTLNKIFDKSGNNPKVLFLTADYSIMTGGCHFFCSCRKFETGCGCCPMINSNNPNDFTSWNVRYRKKIVSKIRPYVSVNGFTQEYFKKSYVLCKYSNFIFESMILDVDKFKPLDRLVCRKKYQLPIDHFIILVGAQYFSEERKGKKYLLEALRLLANNLTQEERNRILIITIGNNSNLENFSFFNQKNLGYVNVNDLPEIYSLTNLFVSPSINDPGPSMVNQSISCGTPVVAFEMGTALDVIKDQGSGFCVPLKDSYAMAKAVERIIRMGEDEYSLMCKKARETALKFHSYKSFAKHIENILND